MCHGAGREVHFADTRHAVACGVAGTVCHKRCEGVVAAGHHALAGREHLLPLCVTQVAHSAADGGRATGRRGGAHPESQRGQRLCVALLRRVVWQRHGVLQARGNGPAAVLYGGGNGPLL